MNVIKNDPIYQITKESYPITLTQLTNLPKRLYVRGKWENSLDRKFLCVIGARKCTPYGREAVKKIISGLRGYPITIVSGLALGIDSLAHEAALDAGLHTISFPGSTLDWNAIVPHEHEPLARRIVSEGGALVSPWPSGYPTGSWSFPARNRLMAGISHATLIIEAGRHSGSLMTADHAAKFHREVYAVPGSVFAGNSYGPHMLIRRGSPCITSSEDVLRELGFDVSRARSKFQVIAGTLDSKTRCVADIIFLGETTCDELIERSGLRPHEVIGALSVLESHSLISIHGDVILMR